MVSVIIPNYNHAKYLRQRIDTVLNQTYQDIELLILDDCSTDNSREIIEEYRSNPKVANIVYNEINSGSTFKQWKKGIELAKGDYIWIAESDDYCEDSLVETLMSALLQNNNCVLGYVQSMVINDDNVIERVTNGNLLAEYKMGKNYVADYLAESCTICNASMAIFKKESYKNISQEFTTFKLCGDWAFWTEIARQGDVFISAKVLNYFRKHNQGVSNKIFAAGNNFVEEVRLLTMLKNEALVDDEQFKKSLLSKYVRFMVHKSDYSEEVNSNTKAAFFFISNKSYRKFLSWNFNWLFFKIKLRKRINLLLTD